MCGFCDKDAIKDYKFYHSTWLDNKYDKTDVREDICIVYDEYHDDYRIWVECEDPFFSGTVLTIDYCPVCGRKLKNE